MSCTLSDQTGSIFLMTQFGVFFAACCSLTREYHEHCTIVSTLSEFHDPLNTLSSAKR